MPVFTKCELPSLKTTNLPKNFTGVWLNGKKIAVKNGFDIVNMIKEMKKNNIFIGFDFDKTGDLMASVLQHSLVTAGINSENIFRVPLTSDGYSAFTHFISEEDVNAQLLEKYHNHNFINSTGIKVPLLTGVDILKIIDAKRRNLSVKNISPDKNSTITYLFKKEIGEI